jgi:hypothetical protein
MVAIFPSMLLRALTTVEKVEKLKNFGLSTYIIVLIFVGAFWGFWEGLSNEDRTGWKNKICSGLKDSRTIICLVSLVIITLFLVNDGSFL